MAEQSVAKCLVVWESIHKPLPVPQFNPCKTCGRTSIMPICGTCQMIAKMKQQPIGEAVSNGNY